MAKHTKDSSTAEQPAAKAAGLPTKRFIIAISEQGSVGKTFTFAQLAHFLMTHSASPSVALFETDAKPNLEKIYKDKTKLISLAETRQLDAIYLAMSTHDIVLVDGMASVFTSAFQTWEQEVLFFDAAREIGAEITFVLNVDNTQKYIQASGALLDSMPSYAKWLVVVNHHKQFGGIKTPVQEWYTSPNRARFLAAGAQEIALDRLEPKCCELLDKMSLSAGMVACDNPFNLNVLEHNRFIKFTRSLYEQFTAAESLLLPPVMVQRTAVA